MDRIEHPEIEMFKERVHKTTFHGRTIGEWNKLLSKGSDSRIKKELKAHFGITDTDSPVVI